MKQECVNNGFDEFSKQEATIEGIETCVVVLQVL